MSKFKQAALTLAMVGLLSAQVHASEAQVPGLQVAQPFSETDINAMFEQTGKPMQLAALSGQEMKETEGAAWWVPLWYGAIRFSPYIPSVGVWVLNQAPRVGTTIDRFRNR